MAVIRFNPYSKFDEIPKGDAPEQIAPGCLVVEGGAFRGLYTQGVMDAFMQNGLNFECTIGVSAGALAGVSYLSGQIGRSARANLGHRHDTEYIGPAALAKSRSLIRIDYLMNDYNAIEPFNAERFYRADRRFIAVATNCLTGEPAYFEKLKCTDILLAAKASASMPFVSPMVKIDGVPYLDGGCSNAIPYQWALVEGYEKIVVIRTRDHKFRKKVSDRQTAEYIYRTHQEFAKKFDESEERYNAQCEELDQLAAEGKLFLFEPAKPIKVGRIEPNVEKLGKLYWQGYIDGLRRTEEVRKYLEK